MRTFSPLDKNNKFQEPNHGGKLIKITSKLYRMKKHRKTFPSQRKGELLRIIPKLKKDKVILKRIRDKLERFKGSKTLKVKLVLSLRTSSGVRVLGTQKPSESRHMESKRWMSYLYERDFRFTTYSIKEFVEMTKLWSWVTSLFPTENKTLFGDQVCIGHGESSGKEREENHSNTV